MADHSSTSSSKSPPPSPRRFLHSRSSSHVPTTPSRLRTSYRYSPEVTGKEPFEEQLDRDVEESLLPPSILDQSDHGLTTEPESITTNGEAMGKITEPTMTETNERTGLLQHYHHHSRVCGLRNCNHGTFSPRPASLRSNYSYSSTAGAMGYLDRAGGDQSPGEHRGVFGDTTLDSITGHKTRSRTGWLSKRRGFGFNKKSFLYLTYYIPFLNWIRQYQWSWFRGDLVAALTISSFYIPMSLSYASNLAHVPPINGLYSFIVNPLVYAMLGSCPQMVVGPEAAGSLLVGSVVRSSIDQGSSGDSNDELNAQIGGVVTAMAGAIIFGAGLARLGFLDSVLSRPFLRGFISAIGFVILVDQAIPELGLTERSRQEGDVSHGTSADKLMFLIRNIQHSHGLTAAVSIGAFVIIMLCRTVKRLLQSRYPAVVYFPERFIVVVVSVILTWQLGWDKAGLAVLGDVQSSTGGRGIPFHWPFQFKHVKHIDTALSTALSISLLGFFESSVAAKSLGEGTSGLKNMRLSPNRELIALGAANVIGGCFMAIPAFGGYGRSKVNATAGGTTPMSSILLSLITLICVLFLLPAFYYLPRGVLSAMISAVAYSLIEEAPHDIRFFFRVRGWTELSLMVIIFLATIFYSLSVGIAAGIGLSLLAIIKHATKPRIQILGRDPENPNRFEDAELFPGRFEHIEGCLIVKITEPLTFANTGQLRSRLKRLEDYGSNAAHPSDPQTRNVESDKNIIFDVHGVTSIDASGMQIVAEIVQAYVKQGRRVIFCRFPKRRNAVLERFELAGIVDLCGGRRHFVGSVEEALKLTEIEDLETYFADALRDGQTGTQSLVTGTQAKYDRTIRQIADNKWTRQWAAEEIQNEALFNTAGIKGQWYASLEVGSPPQSIEFDLDMISSDSYIVLTSSQKGTKFDTFASKSFVETNDRVHSHCGRVGEQFSFGNQQKYNLELALCTPPKTSRYTLSSSGGVLGLSLPGRLDRLSSQSMLEQLTKRNIIPSSIWSITLLDTESGVLSLGGTIARDIESIRIRGQVELENYGNPNATQEWITERTEATLNFLLPSDMSSYNYFKWLDIRTMNAWWTMLMTGVWVNGIKILRNQPVLLDMQCPFILAPPLITQHFYNSISGSRQLPEPHSNFFAYPCANAPNIAFELAGWNFPVMDGGGLPSDAIFGPAGGRFSLGKLGDGNGYCLGNIVAHKIDRKKGKATSGLKNTWILGEPFLRGMGVAFDATNGKIGFRRY